jgi:hypothetical protein
LIAEERRRRHDPFFKINPDLRPMNFTGNFNRDAWSRDKPRRSSAKNSFLSGSDPEKDSDLVIPLIRTSPSPSRWTGAI